MNGACVYVSDASGAFYSVILVPASGYVRKDITGSDSDLFISRPSHVKSCSYAGTGTARRLAVCDPIYIFMLFLS